MVNWSKVKEQQFSFVLFTNYNASTALWCHSLNAIVGLEDALLQVLQWYKVFVPAFTIKNDNSFEVRMASGKSANACTHKKDC